MDRIILSQLEVKCIIGIFDWERKKKQKILIDLEIPCDARRAARTDRIESTVDYKLISKAVLSLAQHSKFFLIETLAEAIANKVFEISNTPSLTVRVSKPGAIRFSQNVGVTITRERSKRIPSASGEFTAYLSLGSNIRRSTMIPKAIKLLSRELDVNRTSEIYESTAVGLESQPPFWNIVVEISTRLHPNLRMIPR